MSYVAAAYGFTLGGLALYALRVLRRGRALTASLPDEERTWR
jgi:hypothetical protein